MCLFIHIYRERYTHTHMSHMYIYIYCFCCCGCDSRNLPLFALMGGPSPHQSLRIGLTPLPNLVTTPGLEPGTSR